jgi:hypothetical protein
MTDSKSLSFNLIFLITKISNEVQIWIRDVFWVRYKPLAIFQPRKPDGFLLLGGDGEMRCWRTTDIASPDTRLMIRSRVKLITHTLHFVVHPYHFNGKYPGWSTNMSCKKQQQCLQRREDEYNSQSLYVAYSNTQNGSPHFQHTVGTGRTNDHASNIQILIKTEQKSTHRTALTEIILGI